MNSLVWKLQIDRIYGNIFKHLFEFASGWKLSFTFTGIYLLLLIQFLFDKLSCAHSELPYAEHRPHGRSEVPVLPRSESTADIQPLEDNEVEYFFASDASAVIEHTNRVIYFEVG